MLLTTQKGFCLFLRSFSLPWPPQGLGAFGTNVHCTRYWQVEHWEHKTDLELLPAFGKSDCCGIAQLISMEVESADCVWHRSLWEELHVNVQH